MNTRIRDEQSKRRWWGRQRFGRIGVLTALAVVLTACGTGLAQPIGDYGDAPDDPVAMYPTKFATVSSRLGLPGVHHLNTGQDMLGLTVSAEAGAQDPLDPDGMPNLIDMDFGDDGLVGLIILPYGSPFGQSQARILALVDFSVAPGAPVGTQYLNILMDTNRDGEWRNRANSKEWVVVNLPLSITPGTTPQLMIPLGVLPDPLSPSALPGDMWMRMTLSRTPVSESSTLGQGGWDGGGSFQQGETEDYLAFFSANPGDPGNTPGVPIIPIPPPGASFKAECLPQVLKLDHCSSGTMTLRVTVRDPAGIGAWAQYVSQSIDPIGPAFGLGIVNGATAGEVGGATVTPTPTGLLITVPINPICDPPERIQSFGVRFRLAGYGPGGKLWAASKTCDVLIFHGPAPRFGLLSFAPDLYPAFSPVPIPADDGGPPVGYVVFGNNQPTAGEISVVQVGDGLLPPLDPGLATVPVDSFFDVMFETPEEGPVDLPEVETHIVGLGLTGYDDAMLADAGIVDEMSLMPVRAPYYSDSLFDLAEEMSPDVGASFMPEPLDNILWIDVPVGFSVWGIQGLSTMQPGDCDGDGDVDLDDYVEIAGCLLGPGGGVSPGCECADMDGTGDVDLGDYAELQLFIEGGP